MAAGLELRRRGRLVARDVSATVEPGEVLLVAGRNGAGKSTLLRVLAGVVPPRAGRLLRPGPPHAYVPERVALAPAMPVDAWLAAMARLRPRGRRTGAPAVAGLDPELTRRPAGALSKGQLQRVVLAEAVSCGPSLLVLDEPWTGLDERGRGWLAEQLRACLERGAVVVVTDHSGTGDRLLVPDRRLDLGGARAPSPSPSPDGAVSIVAVDPGGRRHDIVVPRTGRDERLRALLDDGWAIEEVRPG